MTPRFVVRPDSKGHSVCDVSTGAPANIAMTPQTGLSQDDAEHTARLLNARATQATAECAGRGAAAAAVGPGLRPSV